MKALLLILVLTLPVQAALYGFRITDAPGPAEGYLESDVDQQEGIGALYFDGARWPLTGFDSWWMGGMLTDQGWHMCLIIDPRQPWIRGTILWHGPIGKVDFLSTDGVWYEFSCEVIAVSQKERQHGE